MSMLNLEIGGTYEIEETYLKPTHVLVISKKVRSENTHSYFVISENKDKKSSMNCGRYVWDHGVANNSKRRLFHNSSITKCKKLSEKDDFELRRKLDLTEELRHLKHMSDKLNEQVSDVFKVMSKRCSSCIIMISRRNGKWLHCAHPEHPIKTSGITRYCEEVYCPKIGVHND